MVKYSVKLRGSKGDFEVTVECDRVEFVNSWWCNFTRYERSEAVAWDLDGEAKEWALQRVVVAAAPAEAVVLIVRLD